MGVKAILMAWCCSINKNPIQHLEPRVGELNQPMKGPSNACPVIDQNYIPTTVKYTKLHYTHVCMSHKCLYGMHFHHCAITFTCGITFRIIPTPTYSIHQPYTHLGSTYIWSLTKSNSAWLKLVFFCYIKCKRKGKRVFH